MIDFTGWQYYKDPILGEVVGIRITHSDGSVSSISLQDPEVAKWLAEGNTPLPAENA